MQRSRRGRAALCWALLMAFTAPAWPASARLRVNPANPHWFEYGGRAVALFGSGLWTIIPDQSVDIAEHNRWYAEAGANANRASLFAFCATVNDGNGLCPWPRTGPGQARNGRPKFDLDRWDERFWKRLNQYFADCEHRGIFVLLQMFDEPYTEGGEERWGSNPFNPDNNINDIPGLPRGAAGNMASGAEAAFYNPDNAALMRYEDGLIRRLLDETATRYGNIIYEIGNEINLDSETPKQVQWQQHWIDFFRRYEREHGVQLLLTNDTRRNLVVAAGDGFQVINDHGFPLPRGDRVTADAILERVTEDFREFRRPIINSRPASDPDRSDYPDRVTEAQGRLIFWSYFLAGGHVIGFRTTEESWKAGRAAERILTALRSFINTVDLGRLRPHPELADNHLCLADPGTEYVVYLPDGGSAVVNLSAIPEGRSLQVVRYDPRNAAGETLGSTTRSESYRLSAPGDQRGRDWVFHIGGPRAGRP
jgi:hypothetical protein